MKARGRHVLFEERGFFGPLFLKRISHVKMGIVPGFTCDTCDELGQFEDR